VTVVYAESSAVLSWVLNEPGQQAVLDELSGAERVVTSVITVVECSRALVRARATRRLKAAEELAALHVLNELARTWDVLDISEDVASRARETFPHEPIRTLDALHLSTALVFAEAFGTVRVLSLDERVRMNATALGFSVTPH
jgi:predicted nucleic acid-binding protein